RATRVPEVPRRELGDGADMAGEQWSSGPWTGAYFVQTPPVADGGRCVAVRCSARARRAQPREARSPERVLEQADHDLPGRGLGGLDRSRQVCTRCHLIVRSILEHGADDSNHRLVGLLADRLLGILRAIVDLEVLEEGLHVSLDATV